MIQPAHILSLMLREFAQSMLCKVPGTKIKAQSQVLLDLGQNTPHAGT